MTRNADRVERLHRQAREILREAQAIRESFPPWWRVRARAEAQRRHAELMEQAQDLNARAAMIPVGPPR